MNRELTDISQDLTGEILQGDAVVALEYLDEYSTAANTAIARAEAAEASIDKLQAYVDAQGWRPMEDEPEPGYEYLYVTKRFRVGVAEYQKRKGRERGSWVWSDGHFTHEIYGVTYWQPRPKLPQEGE